VLSIRNTKQGSLLQGLISCKECGYSFKSVRSGSKSMGYSYYRCSNRAGSCKNRGIRIKQLDDEVWSSLTSVLESPKLVHREVSRRLSELKKEPCLVFLIDNTLFFFASS